MTTTKSKCTAGALAAVLAAAASAGCSSGHKPSAADKAGGSNVPTVLRLASVDWSGHQNAPLLKQFADQVAELSDGRLQVRVVFNVGWPASDHEQQIVRDVRSGRYDLGWIAARGWDELGVKSFQALQTPFLITDYALMYAVAKSRLAAQMLDGLRRAGVVGLALVPDTLRHPAGRGLPLVSLHDYAGARIQVERSRATDAFLKPLGAIPVHAPASNRNDGELDPFIGAGLMRSVTGNVVLYARMSTLLVNPATLDRLDHKQQTALRAAARAMIEQAERRTPSEQAAVNQLCRESGVRIAIANKGELAALARAAHPVISVLERDAQTKTFIQEIEKLKATTPTAPALAIPARCSMRQQRAAANRAPRSPSILNGTYHVRFTKADASAFGPPASLPENLHPGVDTRILRNGRWRFAVGEPSGPQGTYTIKGNRITFVTPQYGSVETFTFSLDREGTLRLTPLLPMDRGDQWVVAGEPWRRVGPPSKIP